MQAAFRLATGLSGNNRQETVSVYPSVVRKDTSITMETGSAKVRIIVYNMMGQPVESMVAERTANIRVAGWNSGHYVVRIESDDQVVTKKLIIK